MLFQTTQQQEEFRTQIRKFAEGRVKPLTFLLDKENEFPKDIVDSLAKM